MTRSAHRSPPPSPPPPRKYDAVLDDEGSRVRVRVRPSPEPEGSSASTQRPTLRAGAELEREERLERKLRFAHVVRRLLPADDRRSALLGTALLHRDERLIDQVLATLPSNEHELAATDDLEPVFDLTEHVELEAEDPDCGRRPSAGLADDPDCGRRPSAGLADVEVPIVVEEPVSDEAPDTERESVPPMTLRPDELRRRHIGTLLPPAPIPGDDEPEKID